MPEPQPPGETHPAASRIGLFGDLPTRALHHVLVIVPWFLEPVLIRFWTAVFFLLAGSQRRAVASNLRALHPHWDAPRTLYGAWRVFLNFATTYTDALRCETTTGTLDWEIDGVDAFDELAAPGPGRIVLTAHMGNYDIAAPAFSGKFGRVLHTVRAPEREPATQAMREKRIRQNEAKHPNFRTLYNTGDAMLGVELARLLGSGQLVAVQGDRVIFEVSPMDVEVRPGLIMRLPKGPLALARVTGAPCHPLFITRTGWRRYRITVRPAIVMPPRRRGEPDAPAATIWAAAVFDIIRHHWDQWFVFEPLLFPKPIEERGQPVG